MANEIKYKINFQVQKQALKDLKSQLQQLQKIKISDVMKVDGSTYSQAKDVFMKIRQDAGQVEMALQKAFNPKLNTVNLQTFNSALAASGRSISSIYQNFSKAGATGQAAFRNLSTQILRTNVQMKQSHALLDKMAQTLGNSVKWSISSAAVNGFTRSIEQAWGYIKSLDTSLNDIRIVTGKSADEMANFAVQANNAAKELGKTTTDYTNAALIYAQQGLSDEEIEARARITLKAASVTGQSTDAVSEQLTAVWNGYKVTAEEAELYVDRLAAVAATTASDLQELSTGMSKVASAANAMGVGQDQLAAQLSTIITATKQAPESVGTALRTVYARISDIKAGIDEDGVTLGNYSGKMASLGISVLDMNGNLRDMGEVMEEIGGKWGTMTREQQVYLAQTMAGQRQYNNLLALFDNFQNYTKALDTARNAAGTLQEQQDIYMDSTKAHLQTLKASVEDVYDSFVNKDALDSVNDLIDGLSSGASVLAKFIDSVGGGANILKSLGAIGVTVFSKQIASGIQTTIHNMNLAKQQAQEFQEKIQQVREFKDAGSENQYTKYVLENQEKFLQIGDRMSTEDFHGVQDSLQEFSNVANAMDLAQEKVNRIGVAFDSAGPKMQALIKSYGSLDELLKSDTGVQTAKTALKELQNAYDPVIKKQKELQQAFVDMHSKQSQGKGNESGVTKQLQTLKDHASELMTILQETKTGTNGTGLTVFENLPQEIREKLQEANQELQNAKFDEGITDQARSAKILQIKKYYEVILNTLADEQKKLAEAMQAAQEGTLEERKAFIEELKAKAEQIKNQIDTRTQQASQKINIENITKLAGGLSQVGAGIKQIQNLGSIWASSDINTGQKLSQTFTNLTMTLPMLISGVKTLIPVLTSLSTTLGFTSLLNPFTGIIAAAAIAVTAIMTVTAVQKQLREETIKTNNETIESANKKQQQINANKQLASSLEELNEKYKNGEITRAELRTSIQNLGGEYDLEQNRINRLSTAYQNLTEQIQRFKAENANKEFANSQQGYDAARENFQIQATTSGEKYTADKWYDIASDQEMYSTSLDMSDISEEVTDYIMQYIENSDIGKEMQITNMAGTLSFDFEYDDNKIREFQNVLEQAYQGAYSAGFSKEQRENLTSSGTSNYLKDNRQTGQIFDQFTEATQNASAAAALSDLDFSSIETATDYAKAYEQALNAVEIEIGRANQKQEEWAKTANAEDITKAFFQNNFTDAFNQFDDATAYFMEKGDELGKNFSQKFVDKTKDLVSQLDARQFQELLKVDPKNWKQLYDTALKLSKIDFSYTREAVSGDFQSTQSKAVDQYTKYQQVQNKVAQGKNLSSKQLEELSPELQTYFTELANGQQKMTGDAKEFNQLVNNLKLDGFKSILSSLQEQANRLNSYIEQGLDKFNYEKLNESAAPAQATILMDQGVPEDVLNSFIDSNLINKQLEYLDIIGDTDEALQQQVNTWKEMYERQDPTVQLAEQLADKISEVGDQTQDLDKKIKDVESNKEQVIYQLHDAQFPIDEDIDTKTLQNLTKIYEEQADTIPKVNDAIKGNKRWAEDAAKSVLRFDDAIKNTVDNYKDWLDVLENGNEVDFANIKDDLAQAYADLFDLADQDSLSDKFLKDTENLKLMQDAVNGVDGAYEELLAKAREDFELSLGVDLTGFHSTMDEIQNQIAEWKAAGVSDIQIDAKLNQAGYTQALATMLTNLGIGAQKASSLMSLYSMNATVTEVPPKEETIPTTNQYWQPPEYEVVDIETGGQENAGTYKALRVVPGKEGKWIDVQGTATSVTPGGGALQISNLHESFGGDVKFEQASNGGGSAGRTRRNNTTGKGSGGSKGGGGGSKGKTSKQKKPKPIDPFKDEIDRYHDINIQLSETQRDLERLQTIQEGLFGKDLIDNLNKQTQILEKHKGLLQQKNRLQVEHLGQIQNQLEELGVQFNKRAEIGDKLNDISNYMTIIAEKQKHINGLIDERNRIQQALVDAQNAGDEGLAEYLQNQLDLRDEQIDKQKESYSELTKQIDAYDDINEKIAEINDQLDEQTRKQVEIRIQKFNMAVEIHLDLYQAEKEWNKFNRDVLSHTDILQRNSGEELYKDMVLSAQDANAPFHSGLVQQLTKQVNDAMVQVDKARNNMEDGVYGGKEQYKRALEDLEKYKSELISAISDYYANLDQVGQLYLNTIDDAEAKFDEQIESLEFVGDLLQHDMDLLNLIYGEKNYDAMDKYYTSMSENNLKQVESLRAQAELWKKQWDAAVAAGDTAAAKSFEQKYKKAISNLNKKIEESAQTLRDQYLNSVNKIFDQMDKKVTGGMGSDYLTLEWELKNKNSDEYLDTINAAFAEQDIAAKYQKAIDSTASVKNQRALRDLMEQQVGFLKQKEKLTQYDVDRAEKLLQVEQARIALEEAQAAKTQMRLRRDSQGNYSYQYVVDDAAAGEAAEKLAAAQNDLYNFDKQQYNKNLSDMLSAWKDFQSQRKAIIEDLSLTEEQRINKTKLLQEEYNQYIIGKAEQVATTKSNLQQSALMDMLALHEGYNQDINNDDENAKSKRQEIINKYYEELKNKYGEDKVKFAEMTTANTLSFTNLASDIITKMNKEIVPNWNSGINTMAEAFNGEKDGKKGLVGQCEQGFKDLDTAGQTFQLRLQDLADKGGQNLKDLKNGTDNLAKSMGETVTKTNDLTTAMGNQITKAHQLYEWVKNLAGEYDNAATKAKEAAKAANDFIVAQHGDELAAINQDQKQQNNTPGNPTGGGNANTNQTQTPPPKREWAQHDFNYWDILQHSQDFTEQQLKFFELLYNADNAIEVAKNIASGAWTGPELNADRIQQRGYSLDSTNAGISWGLQALKTGADPWDLRRRDLGFRSGGYTGDWPGADGRIALLHQKELVLNQSDTKNLLDTIGILRSVMTSLGGTMTAKLSEIRGGYSSVFENNNEVDQNVHIEASFPNVDSKREIEEAFNDLVNLAAQRALRQQ